MFHILLALSDRQRHGYDIMCEVARCTDGQVKLGPGSPGARLAAWQRGFRARLRRCPVDGPSAANLPRCDPSVSCSG
jgi:hypothetical protein